MMALLLGRASPLNIQTRRTVHARNLCCQRAPRRTGLQQVRSRSPAPDFNRFLLAPTAFPLKELRDERSGARSAFVTKTTHPTFFWLLFWYATDAVW